LEGELPSPEEMNVLDGDAAQGLREVRPHLEELLPLLGHPANHGAGGGEDLVLARGRGRGGGGDVEGGGGEGGGAAEGESVHGAVGEGDLEVGLEDAALHREAVHQARVVADNDAGLRAGGSWGVGGVGG
jgi:hypothetical protein